MHFAIFTFWDSSKYFGDKFGSSTIVQIGKTAFTAEFLTVANTMNNLIHNFISKHQITIIQDLVNFLEKKNNCETSVSYCVIIY